MPQQKKLTRAQKIKLGRVRSTPCRASVNSDLDVLVKRGLVISEPSGDARFVFVSLPPVIEEDE